jgi:glucose-1-phosphatase
LHAVRELGLRVTPRRFLAEYQTWLRGPYPGALELLERLRPKYRVACLSNIDAVNVSKSTQSYNCRTGSMSASTQLGISGDDYSSA